MGRGGISPRLFLSSCFHSICTFRHRQKWISQIWSGRLQVYDLCGGTLIDKIDGLIWGHKISWEKREEHFHNQ